tara:strand:+ start:51 stop:1955 length:1905 start_codon:yes stop_codon:yes gene_type:complete
MGDFISTSKHGVSGDIELHSANNTIFTGEIPISSYSGHTPILQNTSYLWQIVHHPDASTVRYYSPVSDTELINSLETLDIFTYTGHYSSSLEIALQKYSISDYRVIARNPSNNPIWIEESTNFPTRLNMNGLALYIDSTVPYSYDTAPKDISGTGIQFSVVGTTPEKVIKGGYPAYQFAGNGSFECSVNPRVWDGGGDMTLVLVMYAETVTERDTIFELAGGPYSSYQQSIAVTWETNSALSYYSRYSPSYDNGNTTTMGNNEWVMMAITVSSGLSAGARNGEYSKNGANWIGNYTSNSNTALIRGNNIKIGTGYAGTMESCALGAVLLYNRELSDNEINKLYTETIQPRFGIGATSGAPTRTTFIDLRPPLTIPMDMFFKTSAGTRYYACASAGTANDSVYEFDLSTAWDVTTIDPETFEDVTSTLWQTLFPSGLAFKTDGTQMYVLHHPNGNGINIYQHSLSTAWDITTFNNTNVPVGSPSSNTNNNNRNLNFNDAGTRCYVAVSDNDNGGSSYVYELRQYTLSTAWDITSISNATTGELDVKDYIRGHAYAFKDNGDELYVVGTKIDNTGYAIVKYALSNGFEIDTASYVSIYDLGSSSSGAPTGIYFKSDAGNIFFVQRQSTGYLEEWTF